LKFGKYLRIARRRRAMLRNLIYTAIAALLIWAVVAGIQSFFHTLPAKDRALTHATLVNLRTNESLRDNVVDFTLIEPGKFRCETRGLTDPNDVGRFAYNSMVVLTERNDSLIKTGRNLFTIYGYQDGKQIFEVTYNYDPGSMPQVTLMGPYAGTEWAPKFQPISTAPQPAPPKPEEPLRIRRSWLT
jgi:hypothetical protein